MGQNLTIDEGRLAKLNENKASKYLREFYLLKLKIRASNHKNLSKDKKKVNKYFIQSKKNKKDSGIELNKQHKAQIRKLERSKNRNNDNFIKEKYSIRKCTNFSEDTVLLNSILGNSTNNFYPPKNDQNKHFPTQYISLIQKMGTGCSKLTPTHKSTKFPVQRSQLTSFRNSRPISSKPLKKKSWRKVGEKTASKLIAQNNISRTIALRTEAAKNKSVEMYKVNSKRYLLNDKYFGVAEETSSLTLKNSFLQNSPRNRHKNLSIICNSTENLKNPQRYLKKNYKKTFGRSYDSAKQKVNIYKEKIKSFTKKVAKKEISTNIRENILITKLDTSESQNNTIKRDSNLVMSTPAAKLLKSRKLLRSSHMTSSSHSLLKRIPSRKRKGHSRFFAPLCKKVE